MATNTPPSTSLSLPDLINSSTLDNPTGGLCTLRSSSTNRESITNSLSHVEAFSNVGATDSANPPSSLALHISETSGILDVEMAEPVDALCLSSINSSINSANVIPNNPENIEKPQANISLKEVEKEPSDTKANTSTQDNNQLPGLASILHRRKLRALCRRCQYGRAAITLNRLYPQVIDQYPELLVQLRCRQLVEMVS
ncbi:unnamed protein product [Protopolystoma xenopodis]|uniref:CTLH domain-containing protein n=1 Tax=Protopolystoma xenopodis TaxID=117903 RepID=A0A3S5C033_9PLAT|nr:unnamed protein product [Protopolystoma xenopodis]